MWHALNHLDPPITDRTATIPAVRLSPVNKPGVNRLLTKARKENEGRTKRALG